MKEKERLKAEMAKTKKANAAVKREKSSAKKEGSSSKKKLIVNLNDVGDQLPEFK